MKQNKLINTNTIGPPHRLPRLSRPNSRLFPTFPDFSRLFPTSPDIPDQSGLVRKCWVSDEVGLKICWKPKKLPTCINPHIPNTKILKHMLPLMQFLG